MTGQALCGQQQVKLIPSDAEAASSLICSSKKRAGPLSREAPDAPDEACSALKRPRHDDGEPTCVPRSDLEDQENQQAQHHPDCQHHQQTGAAHDAAAAAAKAGSSSGGGIVSALFSPIYQLLQQAVGSQTPPRHTPPPQQQAPQQVVGACNCAAAGIGGSSASTGTQLKLQAALPACGGAAAGEEQDAAVQLAVTEEEDEVESDEEEFFDPLLFISRLPPLEACLAPGLRGELLPRRTRTCKQKTLVLDLDETLVHSTLGAAPPPGPRPPDFTFPVHFAGAEHMVHVRMRPHMSAFLEAVAAQFEVVVFTASQKLYAEQLLNLLDPKRQLIRHRIYREGCVIVDGNYLKDLSGLGRDLAHTLIIDNSPQAFGFQLDNGVPIVSWYDDDADTELLGLLPFLEAVTAAEDVRPLIAQRFRMRDAVRRAVNEAAAAAGAAPALAALPAPQPAQAAAAVAACDVALDVAMDRAVEQVAQQA